MELTLSEMRKRLVCLENQILGSCKKANRLRESVKLIWVSKFHTIEAVNNAIQLGATDFGENRVQEAELKFSEKKIALNGNSVYCHIIGPVQSNKLKKAAIVADCIHSICSIDALIKLEKVCLQQNKILDILFQVNAGEEITKSGLDIHETEKFLDELMTYSGEFHEGKSLNFPHLRFCGLMTIGKNTGNPEDSRECFRFLKKIQQKYLAKGGIFSQFKELSMGMTQDLQVAIEEGATMIRVGTALFGEREYLKKE